MKIKVTSGSIAKAKADAVIVPIFEGINPLPAELEKIDKSLNGALSKLIKQGAIKGKAGEVNIIYPAGKIPAARLAVVGFGKKNKLTAKIVADGIAESLRTLRRQKVASVYVAGQLLAGKNLAAEPLAQAVTEGSLLGLYEFLQYKTKKENPGAIKQLQIGGHRASLLALGKGIETGQIISQAVNQTRDMVNEPSNFMTPTKMAELAAEVASANNLEITVLESAQITEMKMGGLLGVARGSEEPSKFIVMKYSWRDTDDIDIALVGKGITFDSGGISIKPSNGMEEMKGDMAGAASVISAIGAIARLKLACNVMAVAPVTENMPSGHALKPGDVIYAMNGKSVEIISTDAEGRLILADALCYAVNRKAKRIVDVATLTGACLIALGKATSGLMGNNQKLINQIVSASQQTGEPTWQMPMTPEFAEQIKSPVADIKNVGNRYGGTITAAKFLEEFVGNTHWAHLDIAGPSDTDQTKGCLVKGGTGIPVRTLVQLVRSLFGAA
ncbi:leucyl aminopeptidase [Chloroflexota bacterium]